MRSQIFGFHVQTRQLFEGIFPHPYLQVRQLLRHHLNLVGDFHTIDHRNVTFGLPGMAACTNLQESILNELGEDISRVISLTHQACGHVDSIQRLEKMREALSYNWLKLHQSAAIAQFALGATADNETHMIMTVGWNNEADMETIELTNRLFNTLIYGLRQTKITFNCCHHWVEGEKGTEPLSKRPKYGIRLDTVEKISELKKLREQDKKDNGEVTLTKTEACQLVGLTLVTLKKYDRMLFDRWHEMKY